jgi:hypothetical protein
MGISYLVTVHAYPTVHEEVLASEGRVINS